MNPLLAAMRVAAGRRQNATSTTAGATDFNTILANVKAGLTDPKQEVARLIGSLNGAQKTRFKLALPLLQAIAARQGADAGAIQQVTTELQARMQ